MNIMVTGASGGYGGYAIDYVRQFAPEATVYAMVRGEGQASALRERGFEVRIADYEDVASMVEAFSGIDRLLFVSTPVPGLSANVVAAAKAAGVGFIAYTSIFGIDANKGGLEVNHAETERIIRESGIPHIFLRDNWYLEVIGDYLVWALRTGEFYYFAEDVAISYVLRREYAEAGTRVVCGEGCPEVLDFANVPVTFEQLGQAVAEAADGAVRITRVSRDEFVARMATSGMSQMGIQLAIAYQDIALMPGAGEVGSTPDVIEGVLGRPVTPYAQAIRELAETAGR